MGTKNFPARQPVLGTSPEFENLIASGELVINTVRDGKIFRTYRVRNGIGQVDMPAIGFSALPMPGVENVGKVYYHSKVAGTHVHLVDGLVPGVETTLIAWEVRVKTVEPEVLTRDTERGYEFIVRIAPAPKGEKRTMELAIGELPGDETILEEREEDMVHFSHKRGWIWTETPTLPVEDDGDCDVSIPEPGNGDSPG